ncbi:4688_t:CDS:2, partial [Funneliformis caledonium]
PKDTLLSDEKNFELSHPDLSLRNDKKFLSCHILILQIENVERYSTEQLINFLRTKNLNLNKTDYNKIHDQRVANFLQLTREILRAEPYRFPDGPAKRVATLVDSLNRK